MDSGLGTSINGFFLVGRVSTCGCSDVSISTTGGSTTGGSTTGGSTTGGAGGVYKVPLSFNFTIESKAGIFLNLDLSNGITRNV